MSAATVTPQISISLICSGTGRITEGVHEFREEKTREYNSRGREIQE
jgi:hypothetical protein